MKNLLLLLTCLAFTIATKAQTEDHKWNVGFYGGATQYHGDLGHDFYKTNMPFYGFAGLSVSRYLGRHFDLGLLATKGTIGYNRPNGKFKSEFTSATINLKINFLSSDYIIRPYGIIGAGVILFDKNLDITKDKVDYVLPSAGGGISIRLSPVLSLNLQETFLFTNGDKRDGVQAGKNDDYLFHMAGLTFNFGTKNDADKDGISDKRDNCPNTPAGITVDKNGCPLDKDNDGVADYLDSCPDVSGSKALNGCPDGDNDGIADSEDRCPTFPGLLALKGCPDSDGDGVADLDDKCPNTRTGTKVDSNGCALDNDKDGVLNDVDRCPDAVGPAGLKGCPDYDGDGVADIDDRCPKAKGTMNNKGCPEITKQDAIRITYIGSKIFFENNSDKLKVASLVQLDELSTLLNKYDGATLNIDGYTDSNGSDIFNVNLSQKRTESVKSYLIGKGISATRLIATGLGEIKPIASNKTSLGRAKNRRVELKTTY